MGLPPPVHSRLEPAAMCGFIDKSPPRRPSFTFFGFPSATSTMHTRVHEQSNYPTQSTTTPVQLLSLAGRSRSSRRPSHVNSGRYVGFMPFSIPLSSLRIHTQWRPIQDAVSVTACMRSYDAPRYDRGGRRMTSSPDWNTMRPWPWVIRRVAYKFLICAHTSLVAFHRNLSPCDTYLLIHHDIYCRVRPHCRLCDRFTPLEEPSPLPSRKRRTFPLLPLSSPRGIRADAAHSNSTGFDRLGHEQDRRAFGCSLPPCQPDEVVDRYNGKAWPNGSITHSARRLVG